MKKMFLSLFALLISACVFAEEKVSEYAMSYFSKTYDVETTEVKNGSFTYYVYCQAKNDEKYIGFSLKNTQIDDFANEVRHVKEKFVEWAKTAKDNNVTDFHKDFDTNFKSVNTFWQYGSKWCFSTYKLKAYFRVTTSGEPVAVISSGEMTSSSNRYMTTKGFYMAFVTADEFDEFINAINPQHAIDNSNNKNQKDDLFK